METPNAGLLFNKIIFKRLSINDRYSEDTKLIHQKLFRLNLSEQKTELLKIKESIGNELFSRKLIEFPLDTTWPGLMVGLGYGHSTGIKGHDEDKDASKGEFKAGFYFDFTTGLPVLPGSTIKGILRSFFPCRYKTDESKRHKVSERLIDIVNKLGIKPTNINISSWDENSIKNLEEIIFDGKKEGKKISLLKQDIFFEAIPIKAAENNVLRGNIAEKKSGVFLGEDTITPHKHPLKDPLPLRFLKILPGVTIQFQFLFNDEGIKTGDKEKLFKELLIRFGIGAKSSSGFGKFKMGGVITTAPDEDWFIPFDKLEKKEWGDWDKDDVEGEGDDIQIGDEDKPDDVINVIETAEWIDPSLIKRNDIIRGTVIASTSGNLKVKLQTKKFNIFQNVPGTEQVNSEILLSVQNIEGSLKKGNFSVKVTRKR